MFQRFKVCPVTADVMAVLTGAIGVIATVMIDLKHAINQTLKIQRH
jgi:hypothetical protein